VRVQSLAPLKRPEVDDGRDVRLDGVDPKRLLDRLTVHRRAVLPLVSRDPDVPREHAVVEEPDHLVLVHELSVFEALVGAELPPFLLLGPVHLVGILRPGLTGVSEGTRTLGEELDIEGGAMLSTAGNGRGRRGGREGGRKGGRWEGCRRREGRKGGLGGRRPMGRRNVSLGPWPWPRP